MLKKYSNELFNDIKKKYWNFIPNDNYELFSRIEQFSFFSINWKIRLLNPEIRYNFINLGVYSDYFLLFRELGLIEEFTLKTSLDNIFINGVIINPITKKENNSKKYIIFCHGILSDKWSSFYEVNLCLKMGYSIVIYDARNHGSSSVSFTTLGKVESNDLNDLIEWLISSRLVEKIALYGFSMGAATCAFWLANFSNSRVKLAIFESIFDNFFDRKNILTYSLFFLSFLKNNLLKKFISNRLNVDCEYLESINVIDVISKIKVNVLILHGFEDGIVDWTASLNFFNKLLKIKNNEKINFYLCRYAQHGDFSYLANSVPNSLFFFSNKNSKFMPSNFTKFEDLLSTYLEKNF